MLNARRTWTSFCSFCSFWSLDQFQTWTGSLTRHHKPQSAAQTAATSFNINQVTEGGARAAEQEELGAGEQEQQSRSSSEQDSRSSSEQQSRSS